MPRPVTETEIFRELERLMTDVVQSIGHMRRDFKYILGSDMVNEVTSMIHDYSVLYSDSDLSRRTDSIGRIIILIDQYGIRLSGLKRGGAMPFKQYQKIYSRLVNVRRQLIKLRNHQKRKTPE